MNAFEIYKQSGLYENWAIEEELFNSIITEQPKNVEVIKLERPHGVAIANIKKDLASLALIAVAKEQQRKGIGTELLNELVEKCRVKGVKEIYVGHKVGQYFWPGVPTEPDSLPFFEKMGFEDRQYGMAEDMVLKTEDFTEDQDIYKRIEKKGFTISNPTDSDLEEVMKVVKEEFPFWENYYEKKIGEKDYKNFLICKSDDNKIAGMTMLFLGGYKSQPMFDGLVGGGSCLGVREKYRGNGIGLALKSKGTAIAKERGAKYIVVQYTMVPDFYRKLGFETWRQYYMRVKYL